MQLVMITTMGARTISCDLPATRLIDLAEQLAALDRAIPAARIIRVRYEVRTADGAVVQTIAA
jgi:hypothetical protein